MQITFNGDILDIQSNWTISDFIKSQNIQSTKGLALAINEIVIPKSTWQDHTLASGDRILIIQATQGG